MPITFMDDIPVRTLRRVFSYNPRTGIVRWKIKHARPILAGWEAGCLSLNGYRLIRFCGAMYTTHRIAWAIVHGGWPNGQIDHINRVRDDNRIINLRVANATEQKANYSQRSNNTSGYRGVYFIKDDPRKKAPRKRHWYAVIKVAGKCIGLGLHRTRHEAGAAYEKAAHKMLGGFYRSPRRT